MALIVGTIVIAIIQTMATMYGGLGNALIQVRIPHEIGREGFNKSY
jgi:hypothetical protein